MTSIRGRVIIDDSNDDVTIDISDRPPPRRRRSRPDIERSGSTAPPSGHNTRGPGPNEGFVSGSSLFEPIPNHDIPMFRTQMSPVVPNPYFSIFPPPPPVWLGSPPGPPFPRPTYTGPGPYPGFDFYMPPPPGLNIPPGYNDPWPQYGPPPGPGLHPNSFLPHPRRPLFPGDLSAYPPRPPRLTHRTPPDIPITPINLSERPRDVIFATEEALLQRMVSTYRPLVGVVGREVREQLGLREQPSVKFDTYAVRINPATGGVMIVPHAPGRAPIFRITLPRGFPHRELQGAADALRGTMNTYDNPWHRHAGYVFRVSRRVRRRRGRDHIRYWLPPSIVYRLSMGPNDRGTCYRAKIRSPAPSQIQELAHTQVYDDESGDDQEMLVNEMWRSVQRLKRIGHDGLNDYQGSIYPPS
ncbi:hypothetical protein F4818DRAFT_451643 [Hypoxylon cercidicola]|nr:hypothetical protein F4818DRAFT_451643 [Hypoxylon cercidicola]